MTNYLPYKINYEISTEAQELSSKLGVSWLIDQELASDPYYRLRAVIKENLIVKAHDTEIIPTGIYLQNTSPKIQAEIISFSAIVYEKKLIVLDSPAIFNWSHRNQIMIMLHNSSKKDQYVYPSEIIACLRFTPILPILFKRVYQIEEAPYSFGGQGWIQKLKEKSKGDRPSTEFTRKDVGKYLNEKN